MKSILEFLVKLHIKKTNNYDEIINAIMTKEGYTYKGIWLFYGDIMYNHLDSKVWPKDILDLLKNMVKMSIDIIDNINKPKFKYINFWHGATDTDHKPHAGIVLYSRYNKEHPNHGNSELANIHTQDGGRTFKFIGRKFSAQYYNQETFDDICKLLDKNTK